MRTNRPGAPAPVVPAHEGAVCLLCVRWPKAIPFPQKELEGRKTCPSSPEETDPDPLVKFKMGRASGSPACPRFELAHVFPCGGPGMRGLMMIERACAHRYANDMDECSGCEIGRTVRRITQ